MLWEVDSSTANFSPLSCDTDLPSWFLVGRHEEHQAGVVLQAQCLQGQLKSRVGVAKGRFELLQLWTTERIEQLLALIPELVPPANRGRLAGAGKISHQSHQRFEFVPTSIDAAGDCSCCRLVVGLELGKGGFDNVQRLLQGEILLSHRRNVLLAAVQGIHVFGNAPADLETERHEACSQASNGEGVRHTGPARNETVQVGWKNG